MNLLERAAVCGKHFYKPRAGTEHHNSCYSLRSNLPFKPPDTPCIKHVVFVTAIRAATISADRKLICNYCDH